MEECGITIFFKLESIKVVFSTRDLQGEIFYLFNIKRFVLWLQVCKKDSSKELLQKIFFLILELGSFVRLRSYYFGCAFFGQS